MARILVIRLSALGDVAISIPLVKALANQYPEHEFTLVSQPRMIDLLGECPTNIQFKAAYIYGKHKGVKGLYRFFKELKLEQYDAVCDIHNVIRTRILGLFFRFIGKPVYKIEKQRKEKTKLTQFKHKDFRPLKTSFQRYRDVFDKAGFPLEDFEYHPKLEPNAIDIPEMECLFGPKTTKWLGFAPFAKHQGKIYPLEKAEEVLAHFANDFRFTVFLFGGGKEELLQMQKWKLRFPSVQLPSGMSLKDEIRLIGCMDLVFAMDSANMHLSSLAFTPVVSVWGATHPYAGFYALYQSEKNAIQVELPCRPCSVFGDKPCMRKDYACLNWIKPQTIIDRIYQESSLCRLK